MPEFTCIKCGTAFHVHDKALEAYPNWTPKYCKEHSPKKGATSRKAGGKPRSSVTQEMDLSLAEVLERFEAGPDSGVFTDGSARPNPGPGGWGAVHVKRGEILWQDFGHEQNTTNNRMELMALISAYKSLVLDAEVTVYTDSELCLNILTKWAGSWKKNGWKRKSGPIKNLELVQELYDLYLQHLEVKLEWIKAHNGWRWNEYADSLATAWARENL